jgi:dipeptidase E
VQWSSHNKRLQTLYDSSVKLYLSSYKIGNETERLKSFFGENKRIGYIANALDATTNDSIWKENFINEDISQLKEIGLQPEVLDLRSYFRKKNDLQEKLTMLAGVWVSGGNTFVLRQAYKISGFDQLLLEELSKRTDFVYGGYSAAGCVLSPSLKCYQIVDNPSAFPYKENKVILWDGLDLIDFAFMPHFDSDHGESADIDKEIQLCKENNIPFKALRDGEVFIL